MGSVPLTKDVRKVMSATQPPEETLRQWANHLDSIRQATIAEPFVDCMSDALVWRDETNSSIPTRVIWALRFVFHHRTGLILGEQRPYADFWQLGREQFPHWVGFLPSRCGPSSRLAEIYRAARTRRSGGPYTKLE